METISLEDGLLSFPHLTTSHCQSSSLHLAKPEPGVVLCIEKALVQSGVSREDVNYINAHATSTQAGDIKEYQALIRCFGHNPELKVNSTKSMIGHLLESLGLCRKSSSNTFIRDIFGSSDIEGSSHESLGCEDISVPLVDEVSISNVIHEQDFNIVSHPIPTVGMSFGSVDELLETYQDAKEKGFLAL
ncbi:hypothetical protein Scep_021538 [Stephania cephalantha]|uniref:beta-ketoacyl-[acyl-carrier-protein] synthase I n=1 Tax=Stephania cephalantha TaxID=152367 RepID=A0AAP0FE13_9MAGN